MARSADAWMREAGVRDVVNLKGDISAAWKQSTQIRIVRIPIPDLRNFSATVR